MPDSTLNLKNIQSNAFNGNTIPSDLGELVSRSIYYVFGISGILLLIYLVLGGFQLMTSRGDPKGVAGAWSKITYAFIGFIIVALSFVLTRFIGQIFGLNVFENVIGQ